MTDIFFLALRGNATLTGSPAVEFGLNIRLGEGEPWRATVDHHTHCTTVRFAPGRNAKEMPKGVAHTLAPSSPASFFRVFRGSIRCGWGRVKRGRRRAGYCTCRALNVISREAGSARS